jgi:cytochrome P450
LLYELLDGVQDQGHMHASGDFAFSLPADVLSDLLGVHKEERGKVVQWSVDSVDFFNVIPRLRLGGRRSIQWYCNAGNRGPITLPLVF